MDKKFNDYKSFIGLNVVIYPKIVGNLDKKESQIVKKLIDESKNLFFNIGNNLEKTNLENIEEYKIKDNNYSLNFLLIEESNSARKIVGNIRDIRPTRYLEIQKLNDKYYSEFEELKTLCKW